MIRVLLPAEFLDIQRRIVLAYIVRGQRFGQEEWRQALYAFDLLRDAAILTPEGLYPFPVIYREQVDNRFSDSYIAGLLAARQVRTASIPLWAGVARQITPTLAQILVVFLQTAMWAEIDGDTLFTLLSQIADVLPEAARIVHRNVEITVIDYDLWKEKILTHQRRGG